MKYRLHFLFMRNLETVIQGLVILKTLRNIMNYLKSKALDGLPSCSRLFRARKIRMWRQKALNMVECQFKANNKPNAGQSKHRPKLPQPSGSASCPRFAGTRRFVAATSALGDVVCNCHNAIQDMPPPKTENKKQRQ